MNVISAYMLINKAIPNTGGPYTVRFYDDDGNLIQTNSVPQNGRASCVLLDGTFNDDNEYFKGWNPAPDVVTMDMDCYPEYGEYRISFEEIHDDWATICLDNGAHYPLGAYKTLTLNGEWTRGSIMDRFPNMQLQELPYTGNSHSKDVFSTYFRTIAVKVAEGEDGSASTWMTAVVPLRSSYNSASVIGEDEEGVYRKYDYQDCMFQINQGNGLANWDYRQSVARGFLNEFLISAMPEVIQNHIKTVYKNTQYSTNTRPPYDPVQTQEKIWIPSVKEMCTISGNDILINGAFDNYTQYEANVLKYVEGVDGIAYIKDTLQMTLAQRKALFAYNDNRGVRLRDVTNSKDGPWGGWQTPWVSGDGAIYNMSTNNGGNYGWFHENTSWPARDFIFGFCL